MTIDNGQLTGMFPKVSNSMRSAVSAVLKNDLGKSFLFDFTVGDFILQNGKIVETDDITVWIEKILRSEKHRSRIYDGTDYGITLEDLIVGTNYDTAFTESELRREVEDALVQHPRITGISSFAVVRQEGSTLIEMEVVTVDGSRNIKQIVGADIG